MEWYAPSNTEIIIKNKYKVAYPPSPLRIWYDTALIFQKLCTGQYSTPRAQCNASIPFFTPAPLYIFRQHTNGTIRIPGGSEKGSSLASLRRRGVFHTRLLNPRLSLVFAIETTAVAVVVASC